MSESIPPQEIHRLHAGELLERLDLGESIANDSEIAIVVAHQDDESIAYGSLMSRMPNCLMVHVTDGAPMDEKEWKGAETREQYAHIRERESDIALDRAGHAGKRAVLGSKDQEAALHLADNARKLAKMFEENGTKIVMTHAYEGGHPDHDAVTFSVHAAKDLMNKQGLPLEIIEAPLYRQIGADHVYQNFIPRNDTKTITLQLTKGQMVEKGMLYDAHRSQEGIFNKDNPKKVMSTETEQLRVAPKYDFSTPPNDGHFSRLYGDYKEKWQQLAGEALQELGLYSEERRN